MTPLIRKVLFELEQLAWEDDFQRGLRIARVLVILRSNAAEGPKTQDEAEHPEQQEPDQAAD